MGKYIENKRENNLFSNKICFLTFKYQISISEKADMNF